MLAEAGAPAVLALASLMVVLKNPVIITHHCARTSCAPLRCALLLPPPLPFPPASRLPLVLRIVGLLPCCVAVSPLLAALARAQCRPAPPAARMRKWTQMHWAQQRAGVRPTDSHSGQSRAQSSSAALPGAGAADAWRSEAQAWLMTVFQLPRWCDTELQARATVHLRKDPVGTRYVHPSHLARKAWTQSMDPLGPRARRGCCARSKTPPTPRARD
jgi:hypothetical protein